MENLRSFVVDIQADNEKRRRIGMGCTGVDLDIDAEALFDDIEKEYIVKSYWKGKTSYFAHKVQKAIEKGCCTRTVTTLFRELNERKHGPLIFLTVNPEEDVPFMKTMQLAKDWLRRKNVHGAFYTFEQRGESENDTHGVHLHMLYRNTYKFASNHKQDVKNTFHDVCDTRKDACLHWRTCLPEHVQFRLNYMMGIKKHADKHAKVVADKQWRIVNGLKPWYKTDDFDQDFAPYINTPQEDISDDEGVFGDD